MKLVSIFLFGLFAIKSCGSQSDSPEIPAGTYIITALIENQIIETTLSISFDTIKQRVSGFSGCNRFFGNYKIDHKTITFDKIGSTRMLCEENANQIEMEFLQSLEKTTTFSFENNTLKLYTDKNLLIEAIPKVHDVSFEYVASARGSYQQIIINQTTISKSKKRGGKPDSQVYNNSDWNTLLELLETVDLEILASLEAPSKDFQFDGAAMSKLKVISNGKTYETQSFDHGNPPKKIEALVKEILSISKNIE